MKNNKKGFTLVELLAVIVILAVVILIAVTAVIPRMNNARRNAFLDEANVYAKAAVEANVASRMNGGAGTTCFTVAYLNSQYVDKKDSSYTGWVTVDNGVATLHIKNSKFMVDNVASNALDIDDVDDAGTLSGTQPSTCKNS